MTARLSYQMPMTCYMPRLTQAMATQQQAPNAIGLPPVRAARGVVLDRHLPDTDIYPDFRDALDIHAQIHESIEVPLWHRTRQL